jgi:serine protease AprX
MKKAFLLNLLVFTAIFSFAQINWGDKYFVEFTDKDNSPYTIENPEEYLSQRAIERRQRYNIPIDQFDLPVNPQYIETVAAIGVEVSNPSKWLNGIVVETNDPGKIAEIGALPFVKSTVKNVYYGEKENSKADDVSLSLNKPFGMNEKWEAPVAPYKTQTEVTSLNYGLAYNQIDMIGGIPLHDDGYQGQGMVIAVLDGGFTYTDEMDAFDTLYMNNRILSTRDFVGGGTNVYQGSTHGTSVLSTMGGNLPGQIVGTAPAASYHLIRTEDTGTEYLIEEYNWVSGAEYADSVGADVINSSLGYIDFDNPQQDHSYQDMDGNTAVVTVGADRAMSRGMISVNSAGNSGNSSTWPWIGAPADGDSVFSIGAVDAQGELAGFSSIGPTADGRIKPNIVAQGSGTVVASINGGTATSSGTSFSSPIIAGMTTCLWQMDPTMRNMDILNAIQMSGSLAGNPNEEMGYGIPNYAMASIILSGFNTDIVANPDDIDIFPNPFVDQINIVYNSPDTQSIVIEVADITGKLIYRSESLRRKTGLNHFRVDGLNQLKSGIYLMKIHSDTNITSKKIMKVD